jgi:hypothetical protein
MTKLPAAGRRKQPPKWPLPEDVTTSTRLRRAERKVGELEEKLTGRVPARQARTLRRELDDAQAITEVLRAQLEHQRKAEAQLWAELWKTPQATIWEQLAWPREVAQYVRWKVRAELGDLDAGKEARQWSDRLGLNPMALLRLRWEVEQVDAAESRGRQRRQTQKTAAPAQDPRTVLSVVSSRG